MLILMMLYFQPEPIQTVRYEKIAFDIHTDVQVGKRTLNQFHLGIPKLVDIRCH